MKPSEEEAVRPYERQYERSLNSYPDTAGGWIVWLSCFAPGAFLMWVGYMWPAKGNVWASRRRAENKVLQVVYTGAVYFALFFPVIILAGDPSSSGSKVGIGKMQPKPGTLKLQIPTALTIRDEESSVDQSLSTERQVEQKGSAKQMATLAYYSNVRAFPSKNSDVVGQVDAGEQVVVVGTNGAWVEVGRAGVVLGWVHRSLVYLNTPVDKGQMPLK